MIENLDMSGGNDDDEDDVDCKWVREKNERIYLSYFPFLSIYDTSEGYFGFIYQKICELGEFRVNCRDTPQQQEGEEEEMDGRKS